MKTEMCSKEIVKEQEKYEREWQREGELRENKQCNITYSTRFDVIESFFHKKKKKKTWENFVNCG